MQISNDAIIQDSHTHTHTLSTQEFSAILFLISCQLITKTEHLLPCCVSEKDVCAQHSLVSYWHLNCVCVKCVCIHACVYVIVSVYEFSLLEMCLGENMWVKLTLITTIRLSYTHTRTHFMHITLIEILRVSTIKVFLRIYNLLVVEAAKQKAESIRAYECTSDHI